MATINQKYLPAYCHSPQWDRVDTGEGGEGESFCSAKLTASCQFQGRMVPFPFLWMGTFAFLGTACSVSALHWACSSIGLHPNRRENQFQWVGYWSLWAAVRALGKPPAESQPASPG